MALALAATYHTIAAVGVLLLHLPRLLGTGTDSESPTVAEQPFPSQSCSGWRKGRGDDAVWVGGSRKEDAAQYLHNRQSRSFGPTAQLLAGTASAAGEPFTAASSRALSAYQPEQTVVTPLSSFFLPPPALQCVGEMALKDVIISLSELGTSTFGIL